MVIYNEKKNMEILNSFAQLYVDSFVKTFYYQSYTKKRDNQFLLCGVIHFFGGSKLIMARFFHDHLKLLSEGR